MRSMRFIGLGGNMRRIHAWTAVLVALLAVTAPAVPAGASTPMQPSKGATAERCSTRTPENVRKFDASKVRIVCAGGYSYRASATHRSYWGTPNSAVMSWTLSWCSNGHYVASWGGACSVSITSWGTVNGWVSDNCSSRNDFVPYSLGGYYPGGVDHIVVGAAHNRLAPWASTDMGPFYLWGHNNGSCDSRSGSSGAVYHTC
jgi:hypothetical protein